MPSENPPGGAEAQQPAQRGKGQRFVISHLRAGARSREQQRDSRRSFDQQFDSLLRMAVDVKQEYADQKEEGRHVIICEGDPQEMRARWPEMPPEAVLEPEVLKFPATAPAELLRRMATLPTAAPGQVGGGAIFTVGLTVRGVPLKAATATLILYSPPPATSMYWGAAGGWGQSAQLKGTSNERGQVSIAYDATRWLPVGLVIEPRDSAWGVVINSPRPGQRFDLPPLPQAGPLSWWHRLVGITDYSESRGAGVRIGVVDTGVGPHPSLSHVTGVGAFLDGGFLAGPEHSVDAQHHGTHVCGIIAARPTSGSGGYGGLAPGADVFVARVFKPDGGANQGDIANAIDTLSTQLGVDLLNLSLGGPASLIEQDSIAFALQNGTLCICAAGNQGGAPIDYPAAYPQSVAVSALGLLGADPEGTDAAMNRPPTPDRYTWNGLFLPSFNSVGPQMACTAPGNGIISTVPAHPDTPAPYAELSGTSMAAPIVTASLAARLANDAQYKQLPRDTSRAAYARTVLAWSVVSLGLNPLYQGQGLIQTRGPCGGGSSPGERR
jgi:subtilisin family serine protease